MLGVNQQEWIDKFTIALSQKDTDLLDALLDFVPEFNASSDQKYIQEVVYLFREALELLYTLQNDTSKAMKQIKRNVDFLGLNMSNPANKLNIKL